MCVNVSPRRSRPGTKAGTSIFSKLHMRKPNVIAMSMGVFFAAIIVTSLAWVFYTYKVSIRYKVKSLTSASSEESLMDLLGSPDAITCASPDIDGIDQTYCFVYYGPKSLRIRWNNRFPFIKPFRPQTRTLVHILGKDKRGHIDVINDNLYWGPIEFNRAIVVLEHESTPNPRDRTKDIMEYNKQREQSKQNRRLESSR